MAKDFYTILGLPQNATAQQVRRRFLELARDRHPDRFQGAEKVRAEEEFQQITEAFNVLSDPERRRQHDSTVARPAPAPTTERNQAALVYLRRGIKAYKEKNYLEAAENFDRATQEDPKDAQAWHHLALACSHRRTWRARAREAVERACKLDPMNASYLKLAGRLHAEGGSAAKAEKYYNQALAWGGDDEEISAALTELEKEKGKGGAGLFGRKS